MNDADGAPPDCWIERVDACRLAVTTEPWPFATAHRAAIEAHWAARSAANPAFWNGEVLVLREVRRDGGGLHGTFSLERFSSFLYWRDHPALDPAGLDGFCTAVVRSAEGHVLVGRAARGTLNEGRVYLPGGFIDARDAAPDGTIDIAGCAARELREEIGLPADELERRPGTIVARYGRYCCFAAEWRSTLQSDALLARLRARMRQAGDKELTDIGIVRAPADLASGDVIDHARFVIAKVLAGEV